jgi:hypothetical protein
LFRQTTWQEQLRRQELRRPDRGAKETRAQRQPIDRTAIEAAERWYRFELEVTASRDRDPQIARAAVSRIYSMLGLAPPAASIGAHHE